MTKLGGVTGLYTTWKTLWCAMGEGKKPLRISAVPVVKNALQDTAENGGTPWKSFCGTWWKSVSGRRGNLSTGLRGPRGNFPWCFAETHKMWKNSILVPRGSFPPQQITPEVPWSTVEHCGIP